MTQQRLIWQLSGHDAARVTPIKLCIERLKITSKYKDTFTVQGGGSDQQMHIITRRVKPCYLRAYIFRAVSLVTDKQNSMSTAKFRKLNLAQGSVRVSHVQPTLGWFASAEAGVGTHS